MRDVLASGAEGSLGDAHLGGVSVYITFQCQKQPPLLFPCTHRLDIVDAGRWGVYMYLSIPHIVISNVNRRGPTSTTGTRHAFGNSGVMAAKKRVCPVGVRGVCGVVLCVCVCVVIWFRRIVAWGVPTPLRVRAGQRGRELVVSTRHRPPPPIHSIHPTSLSHFPFNKQQQPPTGRAQSPATRAAPIPPSPPHPLPVPRLPLLDLVSNV